MFALFRRSIFEQIFVHIGEQLCLEISVGRAQAALAQNTSRNDIDIVHWAKLFFVLFQLRYCAIELRSRSVKQHMRSRSLRSKERNNSKKNAISRSRST